ncbi:N-6 DNA methylase, partial [Acinetobacter baumannii]|uniref:N-6 DNA methylase n=1 Tax=Acinetobacter baumannii TaxID=470 RepID=UPI00148A8422
MVDPKLDEKVMDPACGTGGFLTCTIEHKRSRYVKTADDERTLQASIYGVEKKPLPHLLATTNMILHGIEVPNQIRHDNTLARPLISWGPKERVDCMVDPKLDEKVMDPACGTGGFLTCTIEHKRSRY